jgi:RNA polymerase sigma-70 factor (ECF subfamily)
MTEMETLISRARDGDPDAFGELYRAFASPLFSYLLTQTRRREDAEDLLGEVFLAAMRDLKDFTGDPAGFRSWLYRIATNRAIDLARRTKRRPEEPLAAIEEEVDPADLEADALANVERAQVRSAVMELPEEQRRVMVLRVVSGLTASEIAEVVGKRVGAVKALQHRALANLAKSLAGTGVPYPEAEPGRLNH